MTGSPDGRKRVTIIADVQTHMMPALAREMAGRNHNLVVSTPVEGLQLQLAELGAEVVIVPEADKLSDEGSVQSLVDAAKDRFGKFDSACIRTGAHKTGDILSATAKDADEMYKGNLLSVFYALQALLPPLVKQGSGQVVVNTSASGLRPTPTAALYSATRAGANMLVRNAALTVADKGVTVNATGTFAMDYPSFIEDVGASDPKVRKQVEATIPMSRLGRPEEAAHFVATPAK